MSDPTASLKLSVGAGTDGEETLGLCWLHSPPFPLLIFKSDRSSPHFHRREMSCASTFIANVDASFPVASGDAEEYAR